MSSRVAVLTDPPLTPRRAAISDDDISGGSARRSAPRTRPAIRVPPASSQKNPISSAKVRSAADASRSGRSLLMSLLMSLATVALYDLSIQYILKVQIDQSNRSGGRSVAMAVRTERLS